MESSPILPLQQVLMIATRGMAITTAYKVVGIKVLAPSSRPSWLATTTATVVRVRLTSVAAAAATGRAGIRACPLASPCIFAKNVFS